jgi:hypothetical protein
VGIKRCPCLEFGSITELSGKAAISIHLIVSSSILNTGLTERIRSGILLAAAVRKAAIPHQKIDTYHYLKTTPDIEKARVNPLVHYVQHGRWEGRSTMAGETLESVDYRMR